MSLTSAEIANAELDVASLAAVINGARTDPDIVTRTGTVIKPLAKVLYLLATTVLTPPDYRGPQGDPGADTSSIGLLKDAHLLAIPAGIKVVTTTGNEVLAQGRASYALDPTVDLVACPKAGFQDSGGQKFRIISEQGLSSQQFYEATDSSYGQCIQRGLDYLHDQIGINDGGYQYRGSVPFHIPTGDYTSNIPIDIYHSVDVFGDGSGDGGPAPAKGVTHIQFVGCEGFRLQMSGTYGADGVDPTFSRAGIGRARLRQLMLTGDYAGGANNDRHAVIHRGISDIWDIYARNFGGLAVRSWTGNTIRGATNYGGQCSTSSIKRVKGENCIGTLSILGTDSNVMVTEQCQGYQNRQFGIEDGNAAGANKHIGWHCTYNGLVPPVAGPFTQCSSGGNLYTPNLAAVDFTNPAATSTLLNAHAPSGTSAHNGYWLYVKPGAPTTSTPAYASGGPWAYGGDMLALSPWDTEFDGCYMEGGGGLSQSIYRQPLWKGGTVDPSQLFGGTLLKSTDEAYEIIRSGAANFTMRSGGGSVQIQAKDYADLLFWFINAIEGGNTTYHGQSSHGFQVGPATAPIPVASIDYFGLKLLATKYIRAADDLSLLSGARGAAVAHAVHSAAAPTQAEFNAACDQLNALIDRLSLAAGGHGIIA